jgi:hypothetical protein
MNLYPSVVRRALARFPLGSQERLGDQAKVVVKYFFPAGRYTFYVTEGEEEDDDVRLYGYCVSALGEDCDEWGYTMLSELQNLRVRGLTMQRDLGFPIATRTVTDALARAA